MPFPLVVAAGVLAASSVFGQVPTESPSSAALPSPGARGNSDNVAYIGKSDPNGNPVRLARATGHVSNYTEDKVAAYTARSASNG